MLIVNTGAAKIFNTLRSTSTKYPNVLNGSELDTEECDAVAMVTMAGTDSQIRGQP